MHAHPRIAPILAFTTLVAGCTGTVAVKNVETDKFGYLAKTFSVQSIPGPVATEINAKDRGQLPFHRMVVSVTPQFENTAPGAATQAYRSSWTLINVGGAYVQFLDQQTSNGVETRQDYGIAYRNLFLVRGQSMLMSRTTSNWVMEAKSLKVFEPVSLAATPGAAFDYHYEWGNQGQIANFSSLAIHCEYGARYPASKLNAHFLGDAQDLKCDYLNQNGIASSHTTRALLANYGVTLMTRNQTAAGVVNFKFDDVSIN